MDSKSSALQLLEVYYPLDVSEKILRTIQLPIDHLFIRASEFYKNPNTFSFQEILDFESNLQVTGVELKYPDIVKIRRLAPESIYLEENVKYEIMIDIRCAENVLRGSDIFRPGIVDFCREKLVHARVGDLVKLFCQNKSFYGFGSLALRGDVLDRVKDGLCIRVFSVFLNKSPVHRPPNLLCLPQNLLACQSQSLPSLITTWKAFNAIKSLFSGEEITILEMCAAPGNKTRHLLDLLNAYKIKASLYAIDISRKRLQNLVEKCESTETVTVIPVVADSAKLLTGDWRKIASCTKRRLTPKDLRRAEYESHLKLKRDVFHSLQALAQQVQDGSLRKDDYLLLRDNLRINLKTKPSFVSEEKEVGGDFSLDSNSLFEKALQEKFDVILLDAPCSCYGLRPRLEFDSNLNIDYTVKLQRKLLMNAKDLVKVGGFILYSTCTIFPQENEKQISSFITTVKGKIEVVDEQLFDPEIHGNGFYNALLRVLS